MRIITRNEVAYRSKYDLDALLSLVLNAIADAKEGSPEWQAAIESLDNIRQEQAIRNATARPRAPAMRGSRFQAATSSAASITST